MNSPSTTAGWESLRATRTLIAAVTIGPVLSVAVLQLWITAATSASVVLFAHLTALVLWAPFLPTSLSSVLLAPWRQQARDRHDLSVGARWKWLMVHSPNRYLHRANIGSWCAAVVWTLFTL